MAKFDELGALRLRRFFNPGFNSIDHFAFQKNGHVKQ